MWHSQRSRATTPLHRKFTETANDCGSYVTETPAIFRVRDHYGPPRTMPGEMGPTFERESPPRIEFREPNRIDQREIASLWERRTGMGIGSTIDALFDDEVAVHGVVAIEVETVVGFGAVSVYSPEGVAEYCKIDMSDYPLAERNGVLITGVVSEEWEGRGIGTDLMRLRLDLLEQNDIGAAFGTAWLRDDHVDSGAVFEKCGFERLETVPAYYQREESSRDCPDCGDHCECAAAVYMKQL
jgi:GNAT superfamily N-acetyltransferase